MNQVYLIHFDRHYKRAKHYLGAAKNLEKRMKLHRSGKGSKLLAALNKEGIGYSVVRTWDGYFEKERELKRRKNASQLCPKCLEKKNK